MYELQVEGMSCEGCAASVKQAVQAVDGAANVKVDLAGKTVRIDTGGDIGAIKAAVIQAGFSVTGNREL